MDLPVEETRERNSSPSANQTKMKQHKTWFQMGIYSTLVLSGEVAATLLGRLYYEKGGKSKLIAALMQSSGFPVVIPLLYGLTSRKNPSDESSSQPRTLFQKLALPALYICFGTVLAFDSYVYSIGLMYLPLSTFSILCATQLGFNAFFSYFINSLKLTPLIFNSIMLLTFSSVLLVLQPDSSGSGPTSDHSKHVLGFVCTLGGAAGYSLLLSVEQLAYGKALRKQGIREILEVIFYESMVTTVVLSACLFGSGEWSGLKAEMKEFELGEKNYTMILVFAALSWQAFAVGMVFLLLNISSLFANVISTVSVPVVPILAVVLFGDKMTGLKIGALVLAVWVSISYIYQQYLDDHVAEENANTAQD